MSIHPLPSPPPPKAARPGRQAGAAAVELALIMVFAFMPLFLGILEVSRLFYVSVTLQEVTRRAAREQVVAWLSQTATIKRAAVFQGAGAGTVKLPGSGEVSSATVRITFHHTYADASNPASTGISSPPASAQDNLNACLLGGADCINYVRATLQTPGGGAVTPVYYSPMTGWFGDLFAVPLSAATVIMPAEALGIL